MAEYVEHVGGSWRETIYDKKASNKYYLEDVNPAHRTIAGDYSLRIGDCQFFIPPEFINVRKESKMNRVGVIRQSETTKVKSGQSDTIIDIQLWFAEDEQINGFKVESPFKDNSGNKQYYYVDGLRPLISQFKKQPILPVVNYFLNVIMGIDVVSLLNINLSTVEGFPGLIQASLTMYKTTVEPYIEKADWTYDQHFMYPVFRWYYNQELVDNEPYYCANSRKLKKIKVADSGTLTDEFKISYINEAYLMNEDGKKKLPDINDIIKSDKYYIPLNIHKDKFKCTGIMVSLGNILAPIRMDMKEEPTFQYLGGMDTQIVASFEVEDEETLAKLVEVHSTLEKYSRKYRDRQIIGFIKIINPVVNLAGVYYAMINDITVATVPNFPHSYRVEITFISFNPSQYHESRVNGFTGFDIDEEIYDKIIAGKMGFESTLEYLDNIGISKSKKGSVDYYLKSPWWITEEGMAEGVMDTIEVYPDLGLPTYKLYNNLITKINQFRKSKGFNELPVTKLSPPMYKWRVWNNPEYGPETKTTLRNENLFVDPDFYFCYPSEENIIGMDAEIINSLNRYERDGDVKIGEGNFFDKKTGKLRNSTWEDYLKSISNAKEKLKGWLQDADVDIIVKEKIEVDRAQFYRGEETIEELEERKGSIKSSARGYLGKKGTDALNKKLADIDKQIADLKNINKRLEDIKQFLSSRYLTKDEFIKASFHDEVKYNKKGRMARAFPTYCLLFIDEGLWIDYRRMWNNYFSYHAISSIDITRERMQPAHTAVIQFQNIYGSLNKKSKIDAKRKKKIMEYPDWTSDIMSSFEKNVEFYKKMWLPVPDENLVTLRLKQISDSSLYLKTGARIHLRVGYGSIPSMMPTVFNGVVTEIDTGDIVTAFCQSDGVELINPHHEWAADARVTWYSLDVEPSEVLHAIMIDREGFGGWLANAKMGLFPDLANNDVIGGIINWAVDTALNTYDAITFDWDSIIKRGIINSQEEQLGEVTNEDNALEKFFARFGKRSRYGIEHFGHVIDDVNDGKGVFSNITSFIFSENHGLNGYDACKNIYSGNGIGVATNLTYEDEKVKEFITSIESDEDINKEDEGNSISKTKRERVTTYLNGETATVFATTAEVDTDEKNIYFWLSDKSPWDVFQFFASVTPEYETRVFEHGFRSSVFWGKSNWFVKVGYFHDKRFAKNLGANYLGNRNSYGEEVKIAQQLFLLDSNTNIITNNVRASKENIATVVVPIYSWDEDPTALSAIFADRSIKRELQKTEIVETSVLQDYPALDWFVTGVQNLFGYNTDMQTAAYEAGRTHMIWKMREMYQGEIYVLGAPAIKEGDGINITDIYRQIYGGAEVGRITHSFSLETGFISAIKPDLIVAARESINRGVSTYNRNSDEVTFEKTRRISAWWEVGACAAIFSIRAGLAYFRAINPALRATEFLNVGPKVITFIRNIRLGFIGAWSAAATTSASVPVVGWAALLIEIPIFIMVELAFRTIEFMFRSWEAGIIIYPLWHKKRPYVAGIDGYTTLLGGLKDPYYYGEVNEQDLSDASFDKERQKSDSDAISKNIKTVEINEKDSEKKVQQIYYPTSEYDKINSHFGLRSVDGKTEFHKGTDYRGKIGDPVFAIAKGKIVTTGKNDSYGKYIIIRHNFDDVHMKDEIIRNSQGGEEENVIRSAINDGILISSSIEKYTEINKKENVKKLEKTYLLYGNKKRYAMKNYLNHVNLNSYLFFSNQDYYKETSEGKFLAVSINECYSLYAHLDTINVSINESIKAGGKIGTIGNTGRVTGPHLHFEIIVIMKNDADIKVFPLIQYENYWKDGFDAKNALRINPALFLHVINNYTNAGVKKALGQ